MRLARLLFLSILTALAIVSAAGAAETQWSAILTGTTSGSGTFEATLSADQSTMHFTLTFQNLTGTPVAAEIRHGAEGTTGPVLYVLSATGFTSPLTGDTDPAPAGGATGFNRSDVSDLQAGLLYVNLRSTAFPGGEIRGQIVSAVAVSTRTWGRIKNLFR
jgi:hypothetical protein